MQNYSVLMSVYQKEQAENLKESIDSMLAQTVLTDDFVLVCDGPLTKELDQVIAEYEKSHGGLFHVVRLKENEGLGSALNKGLSVCRNELVARMDSDDIAVPERCEKQVNCFEKHASLSIVSAPVCEFSEDISKVTALRSLPVTHEEIIKFSKWRNPFNHPCVMFRKSAVEAVGGYPEYRRMQDYYLWLKMLNNKAIGYNLKKPYVYMRTGNGMYKRRSGLKYLKPIIDVRVFMWKIGYINFFKFIYITGSHVCVALFPNSLRVWIYKTFLRKQAD